MLLSKPCNTFIITTFNTPLTHRGSFYIVSVITFEIQFSTMDLTLLKDIVIIFALSTGANLIFTKLKLPTILGYLLTGIVAGPNLLAIIESADNIEMMAEIGVILLLFTIGMEFSLKHLFKIRRIVFLGGLMQLLFTAGIFWLISRFYGLDWKGGLFMGFLAALSSSALVLKLLQERMELTSNYGRTVLGILIFQDLMLVPLILFTNLLGTPNADVGAELLYLSLKVGGVFVFVYVGNKWLFPQLLSNFVPPRRCGSAQMPMHLDHTHLL